MIIIQQHIGKGKNEKMWIPHNAKTYLFSKSYKDVYLPRLCSVLWLAPASWSEFHQASDKKFPTYQPGKQIFLYILLRKVPQDFMYMLYFFYLFWQIKYFVAFVRDILLCDFVWTTRTRRIVWNFVNRRKVFGLTHKISFCSVTFCQLGKFRGKPCFCAGSCNISSSVFRNWPAAKWHPHHAGFQQNSFPGSYRLGCFLFKDIAEI